MGRRPHENVTGERGGADRFGSTLLVRVTRRTQKQINPPCGLTSDCRLVLILKAAADSVKVLTGSATTARCTDIRAGVIYRGREMSSCTKYYAKTATHCCCTVRVLVGAVSFLFSEKKRNDKTDGSLYYCMRILFIFILLLYS